MLRRAGRCARRSLVALSVMLLATHDVALGDSERQIPAPRDEDYPGVVRLQVDASDVDRRLVRVDQVLPVAAPGPLTLLYPRWLPGNNSTTGPIELLAGLQVTTERGERLAWRRDAEKMFAFHLDVPAGTAALQLRFDFVTPTSSDQGRQVLTQDVLGLQWEKALLYPAGYAARRITFEPTLTLPAGWAYATALDGGSQQGDGPVRFAPTSLERLVDSPVFAGRHHRTFVLDPDPAAPVRLQVFADRPAELEARPEQVQAHRRMVAETLELFDSRHYRRYDFLLAISSQFSSIGLEHHESSENGVAPGYFTDWTGSAPTRDLLPHEFVHSWNGKFRRPVGLLTPSFEIALHDELLWVYEGLSEYWGLVLATRAGLWSQAYLRDTLALYAATAERGRSGRAWRNLQDTTQQPILLYRGTQSYPSWQRAKDYYGEGALLWLDVDTRIRELTRGRRSLDDFARAFFGVEDRRVTPLAYTFEDVVAALTAVVPSDWSGFLRARLDGHGPGAPLEGLARGGWRLAYRETVGEAGAATDAAAELDTFLFSIGLAVDKSGVVTEVYWDSPAFAAGIAPRTIVVAVDGRAYTARRLREAITAARTDPNRRIALLVRRGDTYATVELDYHEGLRHPYLERLDGREDRLAAILAARSPAAARRP
jgi:predicted metalloprotease with PDZ domain